jgi:hypothetical protein
MLFRRSVRLPSQVHPRLFRQFRRRILRSSQPLATPTQQQKYAVWGMCLIAHTCYRECVVQRGGADEPHFFVEEE